MTATLLAGTSAGIVAAVQSGTASPESMVAAAFARMRVADAGASGLNVFVSSDETASRRAAEHAPRTGPLAGVPVAVKDNIATPFLTTSCGSRVLEGYVSPFEATAARKLREAGAVLIGKTTMDEFAMGSSTEHSAFGPARNPLDRARVPAAVPAAQPLRLPPGSARLRLDRRPADRFASPLPSAESSA